MPMEEIEDQIDELIELTQVGDVIVALSGVLKKRGYAAEAALVLQAAEL